MCCCGRQASEMGHLPAHVNPPWLCRRMTPGRCPRPRGCCQCGIRTRAAAQQAPRPSLHRPSACEAAEAARLQVVHRSASARAAGQPLHAPSTGFDGRWDACTKQVHARRGVPVSHAACEQVRTYQTSFDQTGSRQACGPRSRSPADLSPLRRPSPAPPLAAGHRRLKPAGRRRCCPAEAAQLLPRRYCLARFGLWVSAAVPRAWRVWTRRRVAAAATATQAAQTHPA
eukprot:363847-Chlamydomonas_euryale.AAC.3